jgi:arsenate reductase (thioredoxin)
MPLPFQSVLFLCVANSARSQMAEALTRHALRERGLGDTVRVQSAGSAPSRVNPLAIAVLDELGVDSSGLSSKHVDQVDAAAVDRVITLCAEESCPSFLVQSLADAQRLSWAMPDPDRKHEALSAEARLAHFRVARDAILQKVEGLVRGEETTV